MISHGICTSKNGRNWCSFIGWFQCRYSMYIWFVNCISWSVCVCVCVYCEFYFSRIETVNNIGLMCLIPLCRALCFDLATFILCFRLHFIRMHFGWSDHPTQLSWSHHVYRNIHTHRHLHMDLVNMVVRKKKTFKRPRKWMKSQILLGFA